MPAHKQAGATAVEFALIFPMLFILFYSIVVYSYLFVLQESISYAAQEAAAAAHQVEPASNPNFDQDVRDQVRQRALTVLDWLPENQRERVLGDYPCAGGNAQAGGTEVCVDEATNVVTVNVRFNLSGLFPVLSIPLVGELPPMPNQLIATGTALVGEG